MSQLADSIAIRGQRIKNRIVMPPMVCFSFRGDNGGLYGEQHVEHYSRRAAGGTGLVIIQATPVFGAAGQLKAWSAEQLRPLVTIARNCHDQGATVMMQLAGGDIDINELSTEQVHALQADCVAAALRVREAGFDGVEYHFAHGYTFCRFFDPGANRRTDEYGGALENRLRILTEILPQIRAGVGEDFIIGVRMGSNIPDTAGAVAVARALEAAGVDLLHVSFGMTPPTEVPADFPASAVAYGGSRIKQAVGIPVIAVGEIFTPETARFLIETGQADLVAVGRGMLADEDWAAKALAGAAVRQCRNCGRKSRGCSWFTDHTRCPARKQRGQDIQ